MGRRRSKGEEPSSSPPMFDTGSTESSKSQISGMGRSEWSRRSARSHGRSCPLLIQRGAPPNQPNRAHCRSVISLEPAREPESIGSFGYYRVRRAWYTIMLTINLLAFLPIEYERRTGFGLLKFVNIEHIRI